MRWESEAQSVSIATTYLVSRVVGEKCANDPSSRRVTKKVFHELLVLPPAIPLGEQVPLCGLPADLQATAMPKGVVTIMDRDELGLSIMPRKLRARARKTAALFLNGVTYAFASINVYTGAILAQLELCRLVWGPWQQWHGWRKMSSHRLLWRLLRESTGQSDFSMSWSTAAPNQEMKTILNVSISFVGVQPVQANTFN